MLTIYATQLATSIRKKNLRRSNLQPSNKDKQNWAVLLQRENLTAAPIDFVNVKKTLVQSSFIALKREDTSILTKCRAGLLPPPPTKHLIQTILKQIVKMNSFLLQ